MSKQTVNFASFSASLAYIYTINVPKWDFQQGKNVVELYSISDSALILIGIINFQPNRREVLKEEMLLSLRNSP